MAVTKSKLSRPLRPRRRTFKAVKSVYIGAKKLRKFGISHKVYGALPIRIKALLETYEKAYQKSKDIGRPVHVEVTPHHLPKITLVDQPPAPERNQSFDETGVSELEGALTAARERGQSRVVEILSGSEMLSADEFAALLGTTRVTVNAWRQKHQVLGLEGATRGFRFPRWQVGPDGKPFSVLPILFDRLQDAWAVYRFLVQHHSELDGLTGLEAVQTGETEMVIEVAESVSRDFS